MFGVTDGDVGDDTRVEPEGEVRFGSGVGWEF